MPQLSLLKSVYIALHFLVGVRCQMHKPCKQSRYPFYHTSEELRQEVRRLVIFIWKVILVKISYAILNMLGALASCFFVQHLWNYHCGQPQKPFSLL